MDLAVFPARRVWVVEGDILAWRAPDEAFAPLTRAMLISTGLGMFLVWPAWRLGHGRSAHALRETAIDLCALWIVAQVVIWPLYFLAGFDLRRLALMSATLGLWGAATGLLVLAGRVCGSAGARTWAMIGCSALTLIGWLIAHACGDSAPAAWSPFATLWALSDAVTDLGAILMRLLVVAVTVAVCGAAWARWSAKRTRI